VKPFLIALCVVLAPAVVPAQPAPRVTTALPPHQHTELAAVRHKVWTDWFRGDTAALRRILAPELVAITPDTPTAQNLATTIGNSAAFVRGGGALVSVHFTDTQEHVFGETVVMFSRYAVVTERGGKRNTQRGRATEVFVRQGTRWVHTSWHLDVDTP
jgi:ketosteroid isomerase-like protein